MEIPLGLSLDQLLSEEIPVSPITGILGEYWVLCKLAAVLLEGQIFTASLTTGLLIPRDGPGKQESDARGFCSL